MRVPPSPIFRFDGFQVDELNRELLHDGRPIPLSKKAFDLLLVLIENNGRTIAKDELLDKVWPDQFVEEVNITVQIAALRKALCESKGNPRYIHTIPRHGYRFVADFQNEEETEPVIEQDPDIRFFVERETIKNGSSDPVEADSGSAFQVPSLAAVKDPSAFAEKRTAKFRRLKTKNAIPYLIAFGVLLAAVLIGVRYYFSLKREAVPAAVVRSIAVLPFRPLVEGDRDEALELGMAETLITRLSSIREISVRPMSSVRKYSGFEQDAAAAGREQRVETVLDGSIQRSDDKVRVSVRLLRVDDEAILWASQFDEEFTGIFALQDSIAERVAAALAVRLTIGQKQRLAKRYTESVEAYQFYLKGRFFWDKRGEEGVKKAIENFERAIKIDSNYALAYAGLADAYNILGSYGVVPMKESHPKAKAAAMKALEIDDQLAEAHTSLAATIADYYWDWSEAERHFKRAIELNPDYLVARYWYGQYLVRMGRFDESLREGERTLEIDPLSLIANAGLGWEYYHARRYDDALAQLLKTLDMDPNYFVTHLDLGFVYLQKRMYSDAITAFQRAHTLSGNSADMAALLAHAYAKAGKHAEARRILNKLLNERAEQRHVVPFSLAVIYVGLGEKELALKWLERAFDERIWLMGMLKVDPMFDPLRSDRRFTDLLRRIGLANGS